jgi:hypothetical protein
MIGLIVITNGRDDYLKETIASFENMVDGDIGVRLLYDDTGDQAHVRRMVERWGDRFHVAPSRESIRVRGFGGAIGYCWDWIRGWNVSSTDDPVTHVFHLEDDFTFNRPVNLDHLARILDRHRYLAQLALRRQPVNEHERTAGGVVECWPDEYVEVEHADHVWLEHRLFWTTNPSLYRASFCDIGWPVSSASEQIFTGLMRQDPAVRFGYWGARDSGEWVRHIGEQRTGKGY